MYLFVGSTNPVKINATTIAVAETWPQAIVKGYSVPSAVSEQPRSDTETKTGAENRARAALVAGLTEHTLDTTEEVLGIGLEGGVTTIGDDLYSTVWVAVTDQQRQTFSANGARFIVPKPIADIINQGKEMGPVVAELVGEADIRSKQGMIGIITNNFVDRTEEYSGIAKMALGLWYGRNWAAQLSG